MTKYRPLEYKGFLITVEEKNGCGWCVRWEEICGKVIRHSFAHASPEEARLHAVNRVDQYHREIEEEHGVRNWRVI